MLAKRKAQMEIMGLAIIFILVIFGVLFAIRFVITKPDVDLRKDYQQSALAANMLSAIRGTTTDCSDTNVEQLLQDCASSKTIECGGMNSCEKAESVIKQIIEETLDQWEQSYSFSITGTFDVSQIKFANGDCSGEKEVKTHPVPTKAGTIILKLEICG